MDQGVTIHLARRRQQEASLGPLGKAQHVHGANEAGLDCLDWVVPGTHVGGMRHAQWLYQSIALRTPQLADIDNDALVVHWRGWACKVVNLVHLQQQALNNIMP